MPVSSNKFVMSPLDLSRVNNNRTTNLSIWHSFKTQNKGGILSMDSKSFDVTTTTILTCASM